MNEAGLKTSRIATAGHAGLPGLKNLLKLFEMRPFPPV